MVTLPKLPNCCARGLHSLTKICCCACVSLKTSTLIIGFLNLVGSIIGIVASISFMAGPSPGPGSRSAVDATILQYFKPLIELVEQLLDQNAPGWRDDIGSSGFSNHQRFFILGVIMLIPSTFFTIINGCLVHGARKRNACLMKPWIVFGGISLILIFVSLIYNLAIGDAISSVHSCFVLVLTFVPFLVVLSFKNEVENEAEAGKDYQGKVHYRIIA